jgi:AraC-like DNA-binding protein
VDALSEILRELRLAEGSYGRCELKAPWGLEFKSQVQARFHLVVRGECVLREQGRRWRALHPDDVVLLPHGTGHTIASKARERSRAIEAMPHEEIGDRAYRMRTGGAGPTTVLVCCSVTFAHAGMAPLIALMPRVLMLRGAAEKDATLAPILRAMEEEVLAQRVGSATIMVRLADVLIARVIRDWVESRRHDTHGWLAATCDPRVGRALAAMHRSPGNPWSLDSLAREAGTSRSVFAERFMTLVGVAPGRYLTQWRMRLAREWLASNRTNVAEAAARLGYESEAAFSRAFKRFVGCPPSAVRREGREREEAAGERWPPGFAHSGRG